LLAVNTLFMNNQQAKRLKRPCRFTLSTAGNMKGKVVLLMASLRQSKTLFGTWCSENDNLRPRAQAQQHLGAALSASKLCG